MSRCIEEVELTEVRGRSGQEMKKTLNWWNLIWLGTGAVIGAGIFVLTGYEARDVAGPSVVLSYVVSSISVMLSVFCYTEFAVEIPVDAAGMDWAKYVVAFGALKGMTTVLLVSAVGKASFCCWTSKVPNSYCKGTHGISVTLVCSSASIHWHTSKRDSRNATCHGRDRILHRTNSSGKFGLFLACIQAHMPRY